jgi:hypothetical protein
LALSDGIDEFVKVWVDCPFRARKSFKLTGSVKEKVAMKLKVVWNRQDCEKSRFVKLVEALM